MASYLEVYVDNILQNYNSIKQLTGVEVMAVVKADAYGHGMEGVAKALEEGGVQWFGVSEVEEGVRLRECGIKGNILVMAGVTDDEERSIDYELIASIHSFDALDRYNRVLKKKGKTGRVHISMDTGMGRLGFFPSQIDELSMWINILDSIKFEGLYTHFSSAHEKSRTYTQNQIRLFNWCIERFAQNGVTFNICHASNSEAAVDYPEARYDMVRVGNLIYGQRLYKGDLEVLKTYSLKSKIMEIREVPAGTYIGYGHYYRAKKPMRVGVVTAGFYDGLLSTKRNNVRSFKICIKEMLKCVRDTFFDIPMVRYKNKHVPMVGRPSMQLMTVDLTGTDAQPGDYVEVDINPINLKQNVKRVFVTKENGDKDEEK
ncbi:MAG TPA: alanine racemase [Clostridiales bacterium]|nr:alanine racemase [Clostridiales bacterium]